MILTLKSYFLAGFFETNHAILDLIDVIKPIQPKYNYINITTRGCFLVLL